MQNLAKMFLKPTIIPRDEWQAKKPVKELKTLRSQLTNLVVSFTETPPCDTKNACTIRVQEIQKKQMREENKADIQYNFLIGGDGNVYEGRGWKNAPSFPDKIKGAKKLRGNAVEIAFIGEFGSKPSVAMLKAFAGLVFAGMDEKVITHDIKKLKPCIVAGNKIIDLKGDKDGEKLENIDEEKLLEEYKNLGLV